MKGRHVSGGNPYTAHTRKGGDRRRDNFKPGDKSQRQLCRYLDLREDFLRYADCLVGRGALLVLPGPGCAHSIDQFRPLHWEKQWSQRPFFVLLTATRGSDGEPMLNLYGATSRYDEVSGKLKYSNGDVRGNEHFLCSYNFMQEPGAGAIGQVLDSKARHVLFTAANNCLQALVASVDNDVEHLSLPKLVCLLTSNRLPIDPKKVDAIADQFPEGFREPYRNRLVAEAEIVSQGTRFVDAAIVLDADLKRAFLEQRAYEDFTDLLGAPLPNPIRKVLKAANPARKILADYNLEGNWADLADEELYNKLLAAMRTSVPLPELVSDSDLLDALMAPEAPLPVSRIINQVIAEDPEAVARAMRSTFPMGAAVREYVRDDELITAALNPKEPLRVGAYAKIQIVDAAALNTLPSYAIGSFWPTQADLVKSQAPVWTEELDEINQELEPGDLADHVVQCAQTIRENCAG